MRFLIDANLPLRVADVIRRRGYEAASVRDFGLGAAPDEEIARYAQTGSWIIVTRDLDFADIRNYPPNQYPGFLVLRLSDASVVDTILAVIDSFFSDAEMVQKLSGCLAILQSDFVRFRSE